MALWGQLFSRDGRSKFYDQGIRSYDQGQYAQAIESFQAALKEPKGSGLTARLAHFYLAESYSALARGQITSSENLATPEAVQNLQAAIALCPNYADLHYRLGVAQAMQKRYDAALAAFDQALRINADYTRARMQRGLTLYHLGRHADAMANVESALPIPAPPLWGEAKAAHCAGNHDEVRALLQRLGHEEEDGAMRHSRQSLSFFRQGMLDEAISEGRLAVQLQPSYADLRNQLGVNLYAARMDNEAVEQFGIALDINPRYVEARLNRGLALLRLEKRDEARKDFVRVLELDDQHPVAMEYLNVVDTGASPS